MKTIANILVILFLAGAALLLFKNINTLDTNDIHTESNEEDETSAIIRIIDGNPAVYVSPDLQKQAGISGRRTEKREYQYTFTARARILGLQPLVKLKGQYGRLRTQLSKAEASLEVSKKEYQRLELLHKDAANISSRELQQAKVSWISDKAEYENVLNQISSLRESTVQTWGEVLANSIFENDSLITGLLEGKFSLVLVTLQTGQSIPEQGTQILVRQLGLENKPVNASYISRAPYADSVLQGPAYFYYTSSPLVAGTMIEVEIRNASELKAGFYIPESAVVWHADRPWAYVKTGEDFFVRKELRKHLVTDHEWFVEEGLEANDYVITSGAQMLLSEEFHWSIPDEDDNP